MSDKGITLEGLAAAVDALRQELATWKALARKQDTLTAAQITATQSGATAAKIDQIAVNTAAIQALSAQVAGQISLEYVTTLPVTGEPFTLYLVPQGDGTAPNYCNEYLWINGDWELIGTTGSMANNGELVIQVNGVAVGTFTANQAANSAVNITVPTNTNQLVNGAQYVDAAALATALALKQNNLNAVQLDAVNSGITAALVTQIGTNTTAIAGKQDALTTAQQAAVDSGATAAKIGQIATNAAAIVSLTSSKQDTLSTAQLAAVNSGITSAAVQQISTNTGAIATKAADSAVVHLAGTETITGDKTFTGSNTYTQSISSDIGISASDQPSQTSLNFYPTKTVSTDGKPFTRALTALGSTFSQWGQYCHVYDNTGTELKVDAFVYRAYANGTSELYPRANGNTSLGKTANKWKTLNGINPGALGIPNKDNKVNIASEFTDLTGGNNYYIPPADGFVSINADTDIYCAVVSSTHNTSFWRQSAVATSTGYASVTIPVKAGLHLLAKINSTAAIYAEFFPCLGNV